MAIAEQILKGIEWFTVFCVGSTGFLVLLMEIDANLLSGPHYLWIAFIGWLGATLSLLLFVMASAFGFAKLLTGGDVIGFLKRRVITFVIFPVSVIGSIIVIHGSLV